jgi:Ala-tRNA(Pro) deacylase
MLKTKEELLNILDEIGIESTTHEHPAVFTVEEANKYKDGIEGGHSKNLFFRDRKKNLILVVTLSDKPIRIKEVGNKIDAKGLSFAKPERLKEVLGVIPGSVTPLAVINAGAHDLRVILDEEMMEYEKLNFHPIVNTATTTLSSKDLLKFMEYCQQRVEIVRL